MAPKTSTSRTPSAARAGVRQRLGAVMEATVVETALDRVLTKRIRPLRDELKAARLAVAEQADLRADAEARAARAEVELSTLRRRLADLEAVPATTEETRTSSWWRRRRAAEQQPA